MSLIGADYSLSSTSPSIAERKEYITDNAGNFSFNFDRSKHNTWYLYCNVAKYEYDQIGSLSDYIQLSLPSGHSREHITKNLSLKSFGVLKVHCKHVTSDTAIDVGITPTISKDLGVDYGYFKPNYIDDRNITIHYYSNTITNFKFQVYFINHTSGNYLYNKDTLLTLSHKDTTYYQFNY